MHVCVHAHVSVCDMTWFLCCEHGLDHSAGDGSVVGPNGVEGKRGRPVRR